MAEEVVPPILLLTYTCKLTQALPVVNCGRLALYVMGLPLSQFIYLRLALNIRTFKPAIDITVDFITGFSSVLGTKQAVCIANV